MEFTFAPDRIGTFTLQVVSTNVKGVKNSDDRHLRVLSDITPEQLTAKIVDTYRHDVSSYTQGLEFYKGRLFEGTGQFGKSKVSEVTLDGEPVEGFSQTLNGAYFGEGITIHDDLLYQLTWKKGKCFVYSLDGSIQILDDFDFIGQEGWGLCNDGEFLIMSDGTERITFRNPKNFQIQKTIDVYNDRGPMTQLNELEYIDGKIYANVYQTNLVVAIDPESGKVLEQINCDALYAAGRGNGEVLNGIAFNSETGKTYLTGKNWKYLFEVEFARN